MQFTFTLDETEANVILQALGKAPLPWEQVNPLIFKLQQQAAPVLKAAAEAAQKEQDAAARQAATTNPKVDPLGNVRDFKTGTPEPDTDACQADTDTGLGGEQALGGQA